MIPARDAAPFGLPLARLALRRVAVKVERPPVFAFFERMAARGREGRARPSLRPAAAP